MAKTLLQLFNKYIPEDNEAAILNSGIVSRSRVDKEKRCLEVYADFEKIKINAVLIGGFNDDEIEALARDASALVKEITLKIDTIKAKGINEERANEIMELYEEAWDVISKGGLDFAPMKEYVVFLNGQKRYSKAIEKGKKMWYNMTSWR